MSSVHRQMAQPASSSLSNNQSYACAIDTLKTNFSTYNPTYVGSFILFDTEADFIAAINALYSYLTGNSSTYQITTHSVIDLGKKLYIGLRGGESKLLTFTYIKPISGPLSILSNGVYSLSELGLLSPTALSNLTVLTFINTLARAS